MRDENLPLRHRYATELAGGNPGPLRRILNMLRQIGKRHDQVHTSTPNWHFPVDGSDEHIAIPYCRTRKKP